MVWGEPHPYCLTPDPGIEAGSWEQVIYRFEGSWSRSRDRELRGLARDSSASSTGARTAASCTAVRRGRGQRAAPCVLSRPGSLVTVTEVLTSQPVLCARSTGTSTPRPPPDWAPRPPRPQRVSIASTSPCVAQLSVVKWTEPGLGSCTWNRRPASVVIWCLCDHTKAGRGGFRCSACARAARCLGIR
jgi:hypothetical protein